MVYLKVTDGYETRKFQLAGEVTFEQLKQQLATFFPSVRDSTDFALQYRDTERDLITLSTDEELQAALTHLPPDAVWRLHIRADSSSLFDRLFEPGWRPFGLFSWRDQLREVEKQTRERGKKQAQEQKRKTEEQASNSDEEVKSKNNGHVVEHQPHWHVKVYGSWEPRVYLNPFGCRSMIGPVGYHAYWVSPEPVREEPVTPEQSQTAGETTSEAPQATATAE